MKASDPIIAAQVILQDEDAVRWPLPELIRWLNAGQLRVVALKPSANSKSVALPLVQGTLQTIPDNYLSLMNIHGNLATEETPFISTGPVTPCEREVLDMADPTWRSDPDNFTKQVDHIISNLDAPDEFHVYPGNDGTGILEVTVAIIPEVVPLDTADMAALDEITLDLSAIYEDVLTNWLVYRAFSKDSQTQNAAMRAQMAMQLFNDGLGIRTKVEQFATFGITDEAAK